MIGNFISERYRLNSELGRGGMGVVYRGHDSLLKRDVAIKVLSGRRLDEKGRSRLLREAQAVARLNHPNIVAVHDAGDAEGTPFIVMELIEGHSLFAQRPKTIADVITIARQICSALDHAHTHHVVHRDLKPENVLLTSGGIVKLVDFGLARSVASRMTNKGTIAGTVYYLAPELALGLNIDGRTDLYALGVMLYELSAGKLPFTADDPVAIISQHIYAPIVPPQAHNEKISSSLNDLIQRLMSKNPDDRPRSAREVLRHLDGIAQGRPIPFSPTSPPRELILLDRIVRGRMIGRKRELAGFRALWKQTSDGLGQVLLISGEPGVGKSRMVRELVTQVEVAQDRALVGECYPGGGIPYAPFVQIFQKAFRDSGLDDLHLADFVIADLFTLAPMLRLKYPDISPNPTLDTKSEEYRLFEHLTVFFTKLSEQSPLLLVIENIHWADGGTTSLLKHLARQVDGKKWLIVVTYRTAEPTQTTFFDDLLLDLQRARFSTNMGLTSLRRKETGELINAIFGEEVAADFLDGVYRQTEGNPFYIEEVCKSLVGGNRVQFKEGRWVLPRIDQLEIPESVRAAILTRVKSLSPSTQEVLQVASIFGREFGFEALAMASGKEENSLISALEEADRTHLIFQLPGETGRRFSFAHHLIPGAIRDEISAILLPRFHQRAASSLKALNMDDFETLAYHYAEAGDDKMARRYYVRAANRARQMIANQDAARYYSEALNLLPKGDIDRFDLLSGRANVYNLLAFRENQRADAEEMLALANKANDDVRRCDALIALADVYLPTEHDKAREPAEKAVKIAKKMGDSVREGHALRRVGDQAHRRYALASSRSALETAAARFRRTGLTAEAASCLSILSVVLGRLGENRVALSTAKEAVALSRVAGDRRLEATSLRRLAIMHLDQFHYEEALPFAESALRLHQELGDRYEECNDLNTLGVVHAKQGEFDRAKSEFLRSLEIAEAIESLTAVLYAINNLILFIYRHFGEYENGLTFLDDQLQKAQDIGNEFAIATLNSHRANLLASLGQYDTALRTIETVLPVAERLMGHRAQVNAMTFSGLMHARLANWPEAWRFLGEALQKVEGGVPLDAAGPLINWSQAALLNAENQDLQEAINRIERAITLVASAGGSWVDTYGNALCTAARLHLAISKGRDVSAHRALSRSSKVIRLAEASPEVAAPERYNYVHSLALKANGKDEASAEFLRTAHERVLSVANQCQSEKLRRSWLENVPENREILAAWAATSKANEEENG